MVVHAILKSEIFLVVVGRDQDVTINFRVLVDLTVRSLEDSLLLRRNVSLLLLHGLI